MNLEDILRIGKLFEKHSITFEEWIGDKQMAEGHIPINPEDLPIDTVAMEESNVYTGFLRKAVVSPKPDKNGWVFCALQIEVAEGDYEGRTVGMKYLPLPGEITEGMNKAQRIRAMDKAVSFGRFCRAFTVKGRMPIVSFSEPDSIQEWQTWIEQYYDNQGKFTVRNQEWPEGSGRVRSGIADFVF